MDDEGGGWTPDVERRQEGETKHRGSKTRVGGGGMCARPLECHLVISNEEGVGKTNQRGRKGLGTSKGGKRCTGFRYRVCE